MGQNSEELGITVVYRSSILCPKVMCVELVVKSCLPPHLDNPFISVSMLIFVHDFSGQFSTDNMHTYPVLFKELNVGAVMYFFFITYSIV